MRDKKVLLLSHLFMRYERDTISPFLLDLTKGVQKLGYKVFVVVPHQKGLPISQEIKDITVFRFRYAPTGLERLAYEGDLINKVRRSIFNKVLFSFFMFFFLLKALYITGKKKVNIVHAHWWIPSGVVAFLTYLLSNIPYIVTLHGTDIFVLKKFQLLKPLARLVFKYAHSITAVSRRIKSILTSEFGVPSSKIAVFPMPFDFSFFSPVTKSEISETKKVLTVGRLIELKGHSYLIEAIQILKKRGLKIKLILIGEGPRRRLLDAKIQSLGLEREVEVLGFRSREELNYFYNWCDVFVLPSITDSIGGEEGLGVVLLEAGSCKKPVIGTLSGGIPDVIKNNETGLLVPEKDSQALADAIEKVLKDEKLRNRLAENRYKYVRENFTLPKIAEKMANIYQKALKMH